MTITRAILKTLAIPFSLAMAAEVATAHMIQTDYQMHWDRFEIHTTSGGGEAFPHAPVTVYSPEDPHEPVFVGRTDADGKFSFTPDSSMEGEWGVEIGDANDSHWDYLVVPVTDKGVDLDAISHAPADFTPEHEHQQYIAYTFLLLMAALGTGFSWRYFQTNNR